MVEFELFSHDGGIFWNGTRVSIKGVNWFGFETADYALHGLWSVNMLKTLDFASQHFNAIRLPFSAELALDMDGKRPGNIDTSANPELEGLTTGQVVDRFVQECATRGLLVMLDMHRLAAAKDIPELWYDAEYTEAKVLQAWKTIVLRYKDCWNVFAADLNNEPHGCASWGCGNLATDWQLAAERIGAVVLEANPRLLIFVEGVEKNAIVQPGENCWWGGHFAAAEKAPVKLPVANKLVYSPHVYGPDVFGQPYFNDPGFPKNLHDIWSRHFGYIKSKGLGPAICAGEWGGWGKEGGPDRVWQEAIAQWMRELDITDSFYWCLNPNSGDTGGILQEDWVTPHDHKLAIVALAHPNPTQWPHDPVQPAPPSPEACAVEAAVDPAAHAAAAAPPAASAPAAAAGGGGGPAAAAEVPPAAGREVYSDGNMLQVVEAQTWQEGGATCHQLDIKVTNTGSCPLMAASTAVLMKPAGELSNSWNCCRAEDQGGCWSFKFPEWVEQAGGLAPGANIVLGVVVKGAVPEGFQLAL